MTITPSKAERKWILKLPKSEVGSAKNAGSRKFSEVGSTGVPLGKVDKLAANFAYSSHAGQEQLNNATHW